MLYEQESAVVATASGSSSAAATAGTPTPCEAQHAQGALTATAKQVKQLAKHAKKPTDGDYDAPQGKPLAKLIADAFKHRDRLQSAAKTGRGHRARPSWRACKKPSCGSLRKRAL